MAPTQDSTVPALRVIAPILDIALGFPFAEDRGSEGGPSTSPSGPAAVTADQLPHCSVTLSHYSTLSHLNPPAIWELGRGNGAIQDRSTGVWVTGFASGHWPLRTTTGYLPTAVAVATGRWVMWVG